MPSIASVAPSRHSSPCSATSARRAPSHADSEASRIPSRSKMTARIKRGTEESNLEQWFWRPSCFRYTSPPGTVGQRDCSCFVRYCCERMFVGWRPYDDWSYSYLLGLYLGDGWVAPHLRTAHLVVTLDGIYPDIIEEAVAAMQLAGPWQRVSVLRVKNSQAIVVSSYSKHWLDVFPQWGRGRKHQRPIVLADWQRAVVDAH